MTETEQEKQETKKESEKTIEAQKTEQPQKQAGILVQTRRRPQICRVTLDGKIVNVLLKKFREIRQDLESVPYR